MASITCLGTCVPAGPSKNAAACPFTCSFSEGNCSLTQAISNVLFPVPCITGVLIFFMGRQSVAAFSEPLVSHTFRAHFEDSPRLKAGDSLELLCDIAARPQRCFVFRRHVLGLALKSYRVSTDYHRASLG